MVTSIFDRNIEYYPSMYLDEYSPEEIRMACHRSMIKKYVDDDVPTVDFNVRVNK